MSLTDDARAEAERKLRKVRALVDKHSLYGMVPCDALDDVLDDAGHEAASRPRDTPTIEQVVAALDGVIVLPGDRRDWSDGMREAYERRAAHDYTSAWAAARRVYVRETAERVVALYDNTKEGT